MNDDTVSQLMQVFASPWWILGTITWGCVASRDKRPQAPLAYSFLASFCGFVFAGNIVSHLVVMARVPSVFTSPLAAPLFLAVWCVVNLLPRDAGYRALKHPAVWRVVQLAHTINNSIGALRLLNEAARLPLASSSTAAQNSFAPNLVHAFFAGFAAMYGGAVVRYFALELEQATSTMHADLRWGAVVCASVCFFGRPFAHAQLDVRVVLAVVAVNSCMTVFALRPAVDRWLDSLFVFRPPPSASKPAPPPPPSPLPVESAVVGGAPQDKSANSQSGRRALAASSDKEQNKNNKSARKKPKKE